MNQNIVQIKGLTWWWHKMQSLCSRKLLYVLDVVLDRCGEKGAELLCRAKFLIYHSVYVMSFRYQLKEWDCEFKQSKWVCSVGWLGSALKIEYWVWISGGSLELSNAFFCIKRGQLRWFGHLIRMPPGRLSPEVLQACPTGRRPRGKPKTRWRDISSCLGTPLVELENVAGGRDVCTTVTCWTYWLQISGK